jgi:hypothetical protein
MWELGYEFVTLWFGNDCEWFHVYTPDVYEPDDVSHAIIVARNFDGINIKPGLPGTETMKRYQLLDEFDMTSQQKKDHVLNEFEIEFNKAVALLALELKYSGSYPYWWQFNFEKSEDYHDSRK